MPYITEWGRELNHTKSGFRMIRLSTPKTGMAVFFYSRRPAVTDESIFAAALTLPSPFERAAYLDRACAGQPTFRREVEELLAAHSSPR